MTANPFKPADQAAPKVKCLIYGPSGVGKTYLALTAPGKVAVIDTEGGTAFYADRVGSGGLSEFDVLPTKTFAQVEQAIAFLRENPAAYSTLVIDPVTVLYETLQDAAQMRRQDIMRRQNKPNSDDADLEMLDWQRIKRAYKRLMTDLVNLPINVVVTAREAELTEERMQNGRKERVKIGYKPDAEKSTAYYFDVVLRLVPAGKAGREATVEKDRTGTHALNARVASPTFASLFASAIAAGASATGERRVQSDDEAARIDSNTTMVAAELEERDEILTSISTDFTRTGAVARGDGRRSDLQARQMPDGWHVGFRLELGDRKAIPQVVAMGPLGAALYTAVGYDTDRLFGEQVTVHGELFEVSRPGRSKYHRLVLDRIETRDFILPASEEEGSEPEPPPEAPTVPLFDDAEQERLDAAVGAA